MNNFIARCGCNCSTCPTYRNNLKTKEKRQYCSWGWEKYLRIRLSPDKLRLCDGCSISDDERKTYYLNCRVRQCAFLNEVKNCAYCSEFPCWDVLNIHGMQKADAKEKILHRLGQPIAYQDYMTFIEPYEGIKHLNEIRKTLAAQDIKEMKKFSSKPFLDGFPEDLFLSGEEISAYEFVFNILVSLEVVQNVSYAAMSRHKKNREQLLKILWVFGRFAELSHRNRVFLKLNSKTCSEQKIITSYPKLLSYFQILDTHGLDCQIIPSAGKDWKTAGGALRKEGWIMTMTVKNSTLALSVLKALQRYASLLSERYGSNAFRQFSHADMNVLHHKKSALISSNLYK